MRVGTCVAPGSFAVEERPAPEVPEGWVLLDICSVGICGTDYHILEGKHPFLNYPRVIGHELSARVARDSAGFAAGDLVVVNPYLACGTCRACTRGKPNCCMAIEVLGVHRDGGLADQLAVPAGNLYPATGLTTREAAMVEFLAIGAHAAARAELRPGDRVLVTGAGPIGLGTALFARIAEAEVTFLDISPARLATMRDTFGFDATHGAIADAMATTEGDGFDAVFDATGNARAIEAGFAAVAHGGSYVLVSVVKDDITFADPEFHKREMRLIGSRNALRADFETVMQAFRDRRIDADALCSATLTLEELAGRFAGLAADRADLVKVMVDLRP
ncbi:zinc-binding alcohol dehydrogenase family protein [Jannaschia marina]|uniref:zinc-binding alcohol dehydrogenase family protein n=1 Tax=Jannaschia marina TaxID=2741674 RepID=UPI0015CC5153|nr:zinc-binding alcohol dehydrogenase family protein [Jannaschia marina]